MTHSHRSRDTSPPACAKQSASGFSVIELLIAVAIAAILAAVAVPAYTDLMRRSHRSEARVTLIQAAHWMERAATATGVYPAVDQLPSGILATPGSKAPRVILSDRSLTVVNDRYSVVAASESGRTYTLVATPIAGSAQAADKCGSLSLDQAGRRRVIGSAMSAEDCWSR